MGKGILLVPSVALQHLLPGHLAQEKGTQPVLAVATCLLQKGVLHPQEKGQVLSAPPPSMVKDTPLARPILAFLQFVVDARRLHQQGLAKDTRQELELEVSPPMEVLPSEALLVVEALMLEEHRLAIPRVPPHLPRPAALQSKAQLEALSALWAQRLVAAQSGLLVQKFSCLLEAPQPSQLQAMRVMWAHSVQAQKLVMKVAPYCER